MTLSNVVSDLRSRRNLSFIAGDIQAVLTARWYLRSAEQLGPRVRLWGRPMLKNHGKLIIGDRTRLMSTITRLEIYVGPQATLELGESVFINYGCSIAATMRVVIGSGSSLGSYVMLMDNDFHRLEPERRNEQPPSAPIIIGDNVWLGARVIVLRGVTIGAGSVVGAGSIVTRTIPPRSLAVGQPARVVRSL